MWEAMMYSWGRQIGTWNKTILNFKKETNTPLITENSIKPFHILITVPNDMTEPIWIVG